MQFPEIFTLGKSFKKYFEIVPALSETQRNAAYNIRHQVYCEDLKFEAEKTSKLETDEYDTQALHLLIKDIRTNKFIGCTRLVFTRPVDPDYPLPFEKLCTSTIDRSILDLKKLPRHIIAEVSRLAVISSYRRRKGEHNITNYFTSEDYGSISKPRFPYVPIGLYIGTIELARLYGINYLFVLTEKRLANHFKKLGADIQIIGDPVDHKGMRVPSMMKIDEIIKNMRFIFRPLYQVIAKDIEKYISTDKKAS